MENKKFVLPIEKLTFTAFKPVSTLMFINEQADSFFAETYRLTGDYNYTTRALNIVEMADRKSFVQCLSLDFDKNYLLSIAKEGIYHLLIGLHGSGFDAEDISKKVLSFLSSEAWATQTKVPKNFCKISTLDEIKKSEIFP